MAPARVRGCAGPGSPPAAGRPARQADASRRRNGPRKATCRRPITVRLRGKSCPAGGSDVPRAREKGGSGNRPRIPQQADVGTKTRSAGRVPAIEIGRRGYPSWTSSSEVGALAMGSATYEWMLRHSQTVAAETGSTWPYSQPTWIFSSRALPSIPGANLHFVRGNVQSVHSAMCVAGGDKRE